MLDHRVRPLDLDWLGVEGLTLQLSELGLVIIKFDSLELLVVHSVYISASFIIAPSYVTRWQHIRYHTCEVTRAMTMLLAHPLSLSLSHTRLSI